MPTAYISSPRSSVALQGKRLQVTGPNPDTKAGRPVVLREIPLFDLDRVGLMEGCRISPAAMAELMRRDIPISLLGWSGQFLGSVLPEAPAHAAWRLLQYRRATPDSAVDSFALGASREIIAAKIANQRRVIQRLAARRNLVDLPAVRRLNHLLGRVERVIDAPTLLGLEGAASATYFSAWAEFLPAEFPFERRSRRPPHNPVNAVISFASAVLYGETVSTIHTAGLDPGVGVFHSTENGRWSLALDLMEPFRPALIEPLALDLFGRGMVDTADFEPRDGGIYLAAGGRKTLLVQLERRLKREFLSEHAGHRTTLRAQLRQTVSDFKASLEAKEAFRPFRMN